MNRIGRLEIPEQLITFAKVHLQNGRPNWDLRHTRSVVYYAYRIANSRPDVDARTVITASILHDIGYSGLFAEPRASLEEVKKAKKLHMELGSIMARDILNNSAVKSFYTPEQIAQIIYIVGTHDNLKEVANSTDINLRVVVEADTLGALNPRHVKPTFNQSEGLNQIASIQRKRAPLFMTEVGKAYLDTQLEEATLYYQNLSS